MTPKRTSSAILPLAAALLVAGCGPRESGVVVVQSFSRPMTLAVAPVLNFTGKPDFDPVIAADLLASELSYVENTTVVPVSRVVAALAAQGRTQIESSAHAIETAEAVGADGLVVAAITEFDAYTPVVGLILQLYRPGPPEQPAFSAVDAARRSRPTSVSRMADSLSPTGQVQIVYNASHAHVVQAVRDYARRRGEIDPGMGWRQYLKVQTLFLRFCWNDAIARLVSQQPDTEAAVVQGPPMESTE